MRNNIRVIGLCCAGCIVTLIGTTRAGDWPQWGGRPERNHVSDEKNLVDSVVPPVRKTNGEMDFSAAKNVRWVVYTGTASYGNPTVAGGRVFLGTDDQAIGDPRFERTKGGLVKCFDAATGKLLWQLVTPHRTGLPKHFHFSQQHLGTCSSVTVEGDRAYVVTSDAHVMCLDVHGQANGNDGPFVDEGAYMVGPDKPPVELKPTDADIIWKYDLITQAGVIPHDAASCSVLIHGDVLYTATSNGVDQSHEKIPAPDAPAFIALDKRTGRLIARDSGLSARQFHAQWSSPSLATVNGRTLVFLGGGDGWCYAFEALKSVPESPVTLKKVWWYDCNPPEYRMRDGKPIVYTAGDKRKKTSPNKNDGTYVGPSEVIATPVFHNNRIYVAVGQDPAHGRGRGMMHCIDATKTGDITASGKIWSYDGVERTIATAAVADGLVYITDLSGKMHCLDADTGKPYWVHEFNSETWGGPLVADGKVYFGNHKEFVIMAHGKQPKILCTAQLGSFIDSTPVVADGVIYVAAQRTLWALGPTK